jgi:hypothetical protein
MLPTHRRRIMTPQGEMPVAQADKPIVFAGARLTDQRHVCAFFDHEEEWYRVLLPFIRDGVIAKDKSFHIVDPSARDAHLERMRQDGMPVDKALAGGDLEVRVWHETYLIGGHFEQERMLALIESVLRGARDDGFPLTRLVAQMEWALEDLPGVEDLVEYETRLNYVLPKYRDPVI